MGLVGIKLTSPFRLRCPKELTMKFLTFPNPNLVSLFRGIETPKVNLLSVVARLCSPFVFAARFAANAFWKSSGGSVSISVPGVISDVLRMRTNPQVLDSIVQRIPVDVINNHSLFGSNPVECKNHAVNHHLLMHSRVVHVDAHVGGSFGGSLVNDGARGMPGPSGVRSLPKVVGNEVMAGTVLPEKLSGFWIVSKRLLKKFKGRQFFSRMHNQVFGYVFGAPGGQIPDAPLFYQLTGGKQ